MKAEVYNKANQKVGDISLADAVFGVKWNPDLVHQVVVAQMANRRKPWAHTKDRREVSGGGKKPWRQKGTGRARHGSIRSPLWIGGGITFGPRNERNFEQKVNKKMQRLAIAATLSKKHSENALRIVEDFAVNEPKTKTLQKEFASLFAGMPGAVLLVTGRENRSLFTAARNLPRVTVMHATNINVYDMLRHQFVVMDKEAATQLNDLIKNK